MWGGGIFYGQKHIKADDKSRWCHDSHCVPIKAEIVQFVAVSLSNAASVLCRWQRQMAAVQAGFRGGRRAKTHWLSGSSSGKNTNTDLWDEICFLARRWLLATTYQHTQRYHRLLQTEDSTHSSRSTWLNSTWFGPRLFFPLEFSASLMWLS